jgi:hypothetical protein
MAERVCDKCGKKKPIKDGKTCEKGHFLCSGCKYLSQGMFAFRQHGSCPICGKPLR